MSRTSSTAVETNPSFRTTIQAFSDWEPKTDHERNGNKGRPPDYRSDDPLARKKTTNLVREIKMRIEHCRQNDMVLNFKTHETRWNYMKEELRTF